LGREGKGREGMGRERRRWEEKGRERRKGEGEREGLCSFKNSLKYVLSD